MPITPKKPISPEAAFSKAAALCSRSEQAESDIRKKLINWGLPPDDCDGVIDRLVDLNFLSEDRFARAFVHDKFQFNGWGRLMIRHHLKMKGVAQSLINQILDEEISDTDYYATLLKTLKQKHKSMPANKEPHLLKASLVRFAAGRGFEPQLIFKALDSILGQSDDDSDYSFNPDESDFDC